MNTRDDYQFVLLPWEHRGARFDARPDFVASARVGGTERLFLLKAKRNILFFKQAGRGDEFLCALETPLIRSVSTEDELRAWLSQNAEFVQMWWRAEMAQEKYTRVFLDYDIHPNLMGVGIVFFAANGRGWLREPWDESGIELEWNPPEVVSQPFADWDASRFPRGSEILQSVKVAFLFGRREMPQEAIEPQKLEWICGSRDRLEQLVRWIAQSELELWNVNSPVVFIFTCENQYVRAALGHCIRDGRGWETLPRLHELCEIALDYNTPVGIGWEFCDGSSGKPPIRGSWDPCGPHVSIEVAPPTAHELLEARLELREWLGGKAPAEQIESWLGSAS